MAATRREFLKAGLIAGAGASLPGTVFANGLLIENHPSIATGNLPAAKAATTYTRGVGIYPGEPSENFQPVLILDPAAPLALERLRVFQLRYLIPQLITHGLIAGKHLYFTHSGCSVQPDSGHGMVPATRKWRDLHSRKPKTHRAGWKRADLPRMLAVGAERQQDRVAHGRISNDGSMQHTWLNCGVQEKVCELLPYGLMPDMVYKPSIGITGPLPTGAVSSA
jgi:hypothetical protein